MNFTDEDWIFILSVLHNTGFKTIYRSCSKRHFSVILGRCNLKPYLHIDVDPTRYEMLSLTEHFESYLEANGIDVELVQESIGHTVYPVTVDMLGLVQVFVPKEKAKAAKKLLEKFRS